MSFLAKQWDKIGKRLSVSKLSGLNDDASAHIEVIKDDMYRNIQQALDQDGHTGKLSNPDGILRGKVQKIGGFVVQCFGMLTFRSDLDIFGEMKWWGWAKKPYFIKGKRADITLSTKDAMPLGFNTEHEAGNYLLKLIDLYNNQRSN